MEQKLIRFLTRHQIKLTDIAYITKADRLTSVKLKDGTVLKTTIPLKYFLPVLPEGGYLNITKGVIVAADEVEKIEHNVYTMRDGTQFHGRVRSAGEHKQNKKILADHTLQQNRLMAKTIFQQFSVMDQLPLPFSVCELVFDEKNHTIDFIVRYCNEAMAKRQGGLREELLDRPYELITRSSNKKWTLIYTEVALNGTPQCIREIHPRSGKLFTVHFFCPGKNLCACLIVESE